MHTEELYTQEQVEDYNIPELQWSELNSILKNSERIFKSQAYV